MTLLLATLLACSADPPFVSQISPDNGKPGDHIALIGENLSADYTYTLGGKPLGALTVAGPTEATATVPADLPPGEADLRITGSGVDLTVGGLFSVAAPPPSDPCDPSVKRMTHIPSTADVVKIDLYRGEEVERKQLPTRDITRIEYEARVDAAGKYCASIWLQTRGERVLFDADRTGPLKKQAQKIANGLSKPVEVIHEDAFPGAASE